MTLGDNLRNLRETNGLTQKQMAEILSVSKSNVSKYESDDVEPNINTLKQYASYFNVTTDVLLGLNSNLDENNCYNYFYEEKEANWNIRQIAENKGVSYDDMLEKSCIGKTRLDAIWYRNLQPVAEELIQIANVLKVSIDYLLDNSQRERINDDEEIILRYYQRDKLNIMMLLESFCTLNKKDKAILLGKCLELEKAYSVAADIPPKKTGTESMGK